MTDEEDAARASALLASDVATVPPPNMRPPTTSASIGGRSTNWRSMDDNQARDEWTALRKWVEWFTVRYNIPVSTVPNCWWQHDALVEELSALHCAHRAAFDTTDTGNGPISWHEHLSLALPRLTRAGAGCSDRHRGLRPRSWKGATDEDEWNVWVNQTHAN